MSSLYDLVKGQTAETILMRAGGGMGGAVSGPEGDYLRVAAQVRSTQELIESLKRASLDSGKIGRRIVCLTVILVVAGGAQALATAWPYLAWWCHHR